MAYHSSKDVSQRMFMQAVPRFFAGLPTHIVDDTRLRTVLSTPLADPALVGAAVAAYVDAKTRGLWYVHRDVLAEICIEVGRLLIEGDSPDNIIKMIDREIAR